MTTCPGCEVADLAPEGQPLQLKDVLSRWEAALGKPFPPEVWGAYAPRFGMALVGQTCPACGFGRFDPPVTGTPEFYSTILMDNSFTPGRWEFERASRQIKRIAPRNVLVVGCGSGHFMRRVRSEFPGIDLTGYELNQDLRRDLESDGFGTMQGTLADLSQDSRRFDLICMFEILGHVEDPVAFLRAFQKLLVVGGELIVTTPDASGPIRHFSESVTEIPPHHVTRWTERAYQALLPRLNLDILSIELEPLPNYLWDSYLVVLWEKGIWPAQMLDAPDTGTIRKTLTLSFSPCSSRLRKARDMRLQKQPAGRASSCKSVKIRTTETHSVRLFRASERLALLNMGADGTEPTRAR